MATLPVYNSGSDRPIIRPRTMRTYGASENAKQLLRQRTLSRSRTSARHRLPLLPTPQGHHQARQSPSTSSLFQPMPPTKLPPHSSYSDEEMRHRVPSFSKTDCREQRRLVAAPVHAVTPEGEAERFESPPARHQLRAAKPSISEEKQIER